VLAAGREVEMGERGDPGVLAPRSRGPDLLPHCRWRAASDIPGREDEECFPPALRFILRVDGTLSDTRSEPVAADARPGKDGKHNAKLKLIAGLLMMRRLAGDQHPDFAWSELCLATLQIEQHDYPQALATARAAADIYTSAGSATHWLTAATRSAEGAALTGLGHYAEAEKVLTASHETLSKDEGALPLYRILNQRYLDTLHRREKGRRRSTAAGAAAPAE
jgi:hypothetical protein